MKHKLIAIVLTLFFLAGIIGCGGSYYQVKDPATGNVYYTKDIKQSETAVKFKDAKTDAEVTLQNSEVKKISSKEFKMSVKGEE